MAAGLAVAVGGVAFMVDTGDGTDGGTDGGTDDSRDARGDDTFNSGRHQALRMAAWADGMCENMASLDALKATSAKKADTFGGSPASVASSYLASASSALENISRGFEASDPPTRVPDAGKLRAGYIRAVGRVRPEVMKLSNADQLARLSAREKIGHAERVTALVAAIKHPSPGPETLARHNERFESAFNSPVCVASRTGGREPSEQPEPPLPAADGASFAACADGTCEVRVTKPWTDITVRDLTLAVTRDDTKVTVRHSYPSGGAVRVNLSEKGARGTFGRGGDTTVTVELKGMNKTGAVLAITSSGPAPSPS